MASTEPMPEFLKAMRDSAPTAEEQKEIRRSKDLENLREYEKLALEKEKLKATRATGAPFANPAKPEDIVLEVAMSSDSTARLEYLVDPWLPRKQVIGFYGRGGTAKSSFVATLAASITGEVSTLWVSTEELTDWIRVRHVKAGGADGTLFVVKAVVTQKDATGRAMASTFNVYDHLEAAIVQAQHHANSMHNPPRPLRLVVLDTAVALTTWGASESPNSDAGVKRLMAYLQGLCEKLNITIGVIGHSNKGKHDDLSDSVAGSGAWVNSPRQAFTHLHDRRAKNHYVACTVKHSLTGFFAASYSTHPIHTLAERADGNHSVLCAVQGSPIEWDYESARELVDAARGLDEERENARSSNKQTAVEKIVGQVLGLLAAGAAVDRQAVQMALGYEPSRRHWQQADEILTTQHRLTISNGAHGRKLYERK